MVPPPGGYIPGIKDHGSRKLEFFFYLSTKFTKIHDRDAAIYVDGGTSGSQGGAAADLVERAKPPILASGALKNAEATTTAASTLKSAEAL
eukprot:SAG11_NODE_3932_length_2143_cov_2.221624_3_plen_90_part_01